MDTIISKGDITVRLKGSITTSNYQNMITELELISQQISQVLESDKMIEEISEKFQNVQNFLYLGRGYNFPVISFRGNIKVKRNILYTPFKRSEGYPSL